MKHLLWFVMPVSIIMAIFAIYYNKDLNISSWIVNLKNVEWRQFDTSRFKKLVNNANIFEGLSFNSFKSILSSTKAIFTITRNIYNLNRSLFNLVVWLLKYVFYNLATTLDYIRLNLGMI